MKLTHSFSEKRLEVPLTLTESQHLICHFTIHGEKARCLVDTGASNSCLNYHKAKFFGIEKNGISAPMAAAGEEKITAFESKEIELYFENHSLTNISLMLIDMSSINQTLESQNELPIDLIIGADFLQQKKAVIDYHQRCLVLL